MIIIIIIIIIIILINNESASFPLIHHMYFGRFTMICHFNIRVTFGYQ